MSGSTVELPKVRGPGSGLDDHWRVIVLNDDHNTFEGVARALSRTLPGVSKVSLVDRHEGRQGIEIESEPDRDVRRDVARAIVDRGWGLLELRPMRLSLEEIFLQLTTEETGADQGQAPPAEAAPAASEVQHG